MISGFVSRMMAAAVCAMCFGTQAAAADAKFGALAVDRAKGFIYGFAYDQPSRAEAEKRALDEARERGGKPAIVLSWSGPGCGAYRTVDQKDGNAYGWGLADTREMADAIARTEAAKRSGGAPVSKHVWGCNARSDAKQTVFKNEPVGKPGGPLVFSHPAYLSAVALSPDGESVATSGRDTMVMVWSLRTGSLIRTLADLDRNATSLLYSADGKRLIGSDGNKVAIWDARTGAVLAQQQPKALLQDLALSRDGSQLFGVGAQEHYSGPEQGWVKWTLSARDGSTEQKTTLLEPSTHGLYSADYSPANDVVVTGGDKDNKTLRFWDARTGKPIRDLNYRVSRVVRYSPDGRTLAVGYDDGVVLLDPSSGSELRRFAPDVIYDVCFSPDGRYLATAQRNGKVGVWTVETGQRIFEASGHAKSVTNVSFSGDGKRLASGSEDGDVRIWNAVNGEPVLASASKK